MSASCLCRQNIHNTCTSGLTHPVWQCGPEQMFWGFPPGHHSETIRSDIGEHSASFGYILASPCMMFWRHWGEGLTFNPFTMTIRRCHGQNHCRCYDAATQRAAQSTTLLKAFHFLQRVQQQEKLFCCVCQQARQCCFTDYRTLCCLVRAKYNIPALEQLHPFVEMNIFCLPLHTVS